MWKSEPLARTVHIAAYSAACSLGATAAEIGDALFGATPPAVSGRARLISGREVPVGRLPFALAPHEAIPDSRSNRLLAHCLAPLLPILEHAIASVGARRVGIVLGSSTAGIDLATDAVVGLKRESAPIAPDVLARQELFDPVRAAQAMLPASGPVYAISTACTSGAKSLAAAGRMIATGLCDVVLCGGVDTIGSLTLNGFDALDALASGVSNPFSVHGSGSNLGDGAALFVLTAAPAAWRLAGWGESSDAHHVSSPDPSGAGAILALDKALGAAALPASAIGYIHLHGTGTVLNDAMEARAVNSLFGPDMPCSSTKPMTGHTLGAAGALQAAFCLMAMERGQLPPQRWDGHYDPALPPVNIVGKAATAPHRLDALLSANYAFGGNNIGLVLARS